MDDWTQPLSIPDADVPSAQPMLFGQVWSAAEEGLRAAQAGGAAQAEADRRVVDLERAWIWDGVDDRRNLLDVPLPLETPARPPTSY